MSPRPHRLLAAFPLLVAIVAFVLVVHVFVFEAVRPEAAVAATLDPVEHPEGRNRPDTVFVKPGIAKRAATLALRMVGTPYRWGGESPASGFDCSGLIRWAYGQVGLDLPHNSHALYGEGRVVARTRMETGDVLFFSGLGHVGLYLGGGRMVHAPYSGKNVEIVRLGESHYGGRLVGARRVTPA